MISFRKSSFSGLIRGEIVDEIRYKPIGIIHSPFKEPYGIPIQAARARDICLLKGNDPLFFEKVREHSRNLI
jgi:hypothetical protein